MMARHGAKVMGCDVNAEHAEATAKTARSEGLEFDTVHPCDLTQPAEVDRLVHRTVARFGGIDTLVNAAATADFHWIEEMEYEAHWRHTLTAELDSC